MDPDRITESDIDPRVEGDYVLADSDLLTYDEWWREHEMNFCCSTPAEAARRDCGCGGYGSVLPTTASRLLAPGEPDGEDFHNRRMESRAAYRREQEWH